MTVPGALAGWDALLKKYGTITLAQALQPAIGYAENGYPSSRRSSPSDWAEREELLARDAGAKATFLLERRRAEGGRLVPAIPISPRTLREIAKEGPATFYGGALGQKIVTRIQQLGGFLTIDDLQEEPADVGDADLDDVQGLSRLGAAAEQSGHRGARDAAHSRAVRSQVDGAELGGVSASSHRGEEARVRRSREVRRRCGSSHAAAGADARRTRSSPSGAATSIEHKAQARVEPGPERTSSETIYLTVADKDGNMVSFINSLFDEFGSGVVVPGTGFVLHDRGLGLHDGAGTAEHRRAGQASVPHADSGLRHEAGRDDARPTARGDEPYMSFGLMGGAMQAQGHAQFLINHLVFGMDMQEAMDVGALPPRERRARDRRVGDARRAYRRPQGAGPRGDDREVRRQFGGSQAIIKLRTGTSRARIRERTGTPLATSAVI